MILMMPGAKNLPSIYSPRNMLSGSLADTKERRVKRVTAERDRCLVQEIACKQTTETNISPRGEEELPGGKGLVKWDYMALS